MRYNSIGEYFYRLSNRCLGLALLPVVLVLGIFLLNQYFFNFSSSITISSDQQFILLLVTGALMVLLFWLQWVMARTRLAPLILEPSLGSRIQKYIPIVMVRFRTFSFMVLLTGVCIFVTTELNYLYLLPIPVLSFILYWPGRWRIAKDLRLKTEEKEILRNNNLGV